MVPPDADNPDNEEEREGSVETEERPKIQKARRFRVIFHNDDYTTMEFVIQVLEGIFQKSPSEAYQIMMHVHVNGRGIAGLYPWEQAETKAEQVISTAREAGYPLKAVTEEA